MGIFGNDEQQDKRLDALEKHLRELTQTVQTNQADLAEARISLLGLQARIDEKVSISDVDPMLIKLNEDLDIARKELESKRYTLGDLAEDIAEAMARWPVRP